MRQPAVATLSALIAAATVAAPAAHAARWAYVSVQTDNKVAIVDVDTAAVVDTVRVGRPGGLDVHPDGRTVYVAAWNEGQVVAIDVASRSRTDFPMTTAGPSAVAVHPDGARVFVSSRVDAALTVLDPAFPGQARTIGLATTAGMYVAVSPDGNHVYVAHMDGELSVVDVSVPGQEALVATLTDVAPNPTGLVGVFVDHVWVSSGTDNRVLSVDTRTGQRLVLLHGGSPAGLAVRGDGWAAIAPVVYVAMRSAHQLKRLLVGTTAAVGDQPVDVAWSEGDPADLADDVWISADAGSDTATLIGPAGAVPVSVGDLPIAVAAGKTVQLPSFLRLSTWRLGFAYRDVTQQIVKPIYVTNVGGPKLKVAGLTWRGAKPARFTIVDDGCGGRALAAGASCKITVGYQPAGDGRDEASLGIASSDPGAPTAWLSLVGAPVLD